MRFAAFTTPVIAVVLVVAVGSAQAQTGPLTAVDYDVQSSSTNTDRPGEYLLAGGKVFVPPGPAPPTEEQIPYEDAEAALGLVPFDHWAYDAVEMLMKQGIIINYPKAGFRGDRPLTRYEFAMAISRLLATLRTTRAGEKGDRGLQGPRGEAGPAGPAGNQGPQGPPGPSPEVDELVEGLTREFENELRLIREDTGDLGNRVSDISDRIRQIEERHPFPIPFGFVDYRIGTVCGDIDLDHEFDALTMRFGIEGYIDDDTYGRIAMQMADGRQPLAALGIELGEAPQPAVPPGPSPHPKLGYLGNDIYLDEAWVRFTTDWITDAEWTVGRQFQAYGLGLVVNNERLSQQGVHCLIDDLFIDPLSFQFFLGGANYDYLSHPWSDNNDGYASAYLQYSQENWSVGVPWLINGYSTDTADDRHFDEEVWGVDVWWNFMGDQDLYFEYANQSGHANRALFTRGGTTNPEAYMLTVDLLSTPDIELTGVVTDVEAEYDVVYSSLHPYYELLCTAPRPHAMQPFPYERWLRRPLAIPNLQATGGQGTFYYNDGNWPLDFFYYHISTNSDWWEASPLDDLYYDELYGLRVRREIDRGVECSLTWAHQEPIDSTTNPTSDLLQFRTTLAF